MLFLCLAILSSSAISVLMRFSAGKISAKLSMLSFNYLICAFLGAAYAGFDLLRPDISGFPLTVAFGFISGIFYLGGFVLFQWNTAKNGIVLSSVFMKLGLLVPMVLSVVLFHELPTANHASNQSHNPTPNRLNTPFSTHRPTYSHPYQTCGRQLSNSVEFCRLHDRISAIHP